MRILITLLILTSTLWAQSPVLDFYVERGLENNLALKQKEISLQQSLQALQEAKGMFLPSVEISARYSRAGGGRIIEFPVGDLMNPVYATLNEMLGLVGRPPAFPTTLENETIPFLRKEEQETKLRIIQPIFQPAIYYNLKIKSSLKEVRKVELEIYKRQLVADIKTAYFNFLKTKHVTDLYQKTHQLLVENLRVSEKLFQNQKATEEVVFQARAELAKLAQREAEAEKNQKMARAYLNFLVNEPLKQAVKIPDEIFVDTEKEFDQNQLVETALESRLEFRQMQNAIKATKYQAKLNQANYLPNLTGVFDYGIQGEKYSFKKDDDYWMASAVLNWNLFNGGQDRAKQQQSVLARNKLETQLLELKLQIQLEVENAVNELIVSQKSIKAAGEQQLSAKKSFQIIRKKFEQGMAPQIEFLNARTALTNAEKAFIIEKYDYQIKLAELQRIVNQ